MCTDIDSILSSRLRRPVVQRQVDVKAGSEYVVDLDLRSNS